MFSSTLPIARDGTLPVSLTVRSQVRSQHTPKNTSEYTPQYTSESLPSTLLNALHDILPAYMALLFGIHSPEARHSQSHLNICSDVCSCVLGSETCRVAGTGGPEAGGVRWATYGSRIPDVGQYHSLNLFFTAATLTRSHDASWSWC
jgi:hypothetical protein